MFRFHHYHTIFTRTQQSATVIYIIILLLLILVIHSFPILNMILYHLMNPNSCGFTRLLIWLQFFEGFLWFGLVHSRFILLVDHLNQENLKTNQKYLAVLEIHGQVRRWPKSILCTFITLSCFLSSYLTLLRSNGLLLAKVHWYISLLFSLTSLESPPTL